MITDYNKLVQNEINVAYKKGKTEGFQLAYNLIHKIYDEYRNSMDTTQSELNVLDTIISLFLAHKF